MKKITSFIIITIMILSSFALFGCRDDEEEQIDTFLHTHYDEIKAMLEKAEDTDDVTSYLTEWADNAGIKVNKDRESNVIMTADPTDGYEDAESAIFQCTVDLEDPDRTALSMSIASYIISESEQHGLIRAVFTSSPESIEKLGNVYLLGIDNFISLDWYGENELLYGSAGSEYYTITHELDWNLPSYTQAYDISVFIPDNIPYSDTHLHENSIRAVGNILARAKSSNILLEVAGFNGGDAADTYPARVSCTVLVNQNEVASLGRIVNEVKAEFDDMYSSDESGYFFNFTETDVPDKVISYEDTANLISFLYTCIDGTYIKDDNGEVIARTNIGKIRTTSGNLEIEICASSKSSAALTEMNSVFDTICGLCDISYESRPVIPVWESNSEIKSNSLIGAIDSETNEITGKKTKKIRIFDENVCSLAALCNPEMNVIAFGVTEDSMLETTEIFINYLADSSGLPDE